MKKLLFPLILACAITALPCLADETPSPTPVLAEKPLALTYRKANQEELRSITKNKQMSRAEKQYIRNCPVISMQIENAGSNDEFFLFRKDSRGQINQIGNERKKADGRIVVILDGYYMPGEPVDIIAVTTDKKKAASIRLSPSPIEARGKNNARVLSIESCSGDRLRYIIRVEGFEPDELLTIHTKSGYKTDSAEVKFNPEKPELFSFAPIVPGNNFGTAIVELTAKNPDEVLRVEFEWGISKALLSKMREVNAKHHY